MADVGTDISIAKKFLIQGGLVAIPTETVYGLAANGFEKNFVIKIFEAKNRPFFDPLILHSHSIEKIKLFVKEFSPTALKLAEKFWPGPLTLLLPKKEIVPDIVTSGLPDVAVRVPDHPLTLQLLSQLDFPLAAPSANLFGAVSPTSAAHVQQQLGEKINYILDGGACKVGIESTIVGFENENAVVYRLGGLALEEIEKTCGKVILRINNSSNPNAPGQLKSHYATRKPLMHGSIDEAVEKFEYKRMGVISFCKEYNGQINFVLSPKGDLKEAAHNLFKAMRQLDENENVDFIFAEIFPNEFLGRAINDRLQRASV